MWNIFITCVLDKILIIMSRNYGTVSETDKHIVACFFYYMHII